MKCFLPAAALAALLIATPALATPQSITRTGHVIAQIPQDDFWNGAGLASLPGIALGDTIQFSATYDDADAETPWPRATAFGEVYDRPDIHTVGLGNGRAGNSASLDVGGLHFDLADQFCFQDPGCIAANGLEFDTGPTLMFHGAGFLGMDSCLHAHGVFACQLVFDNLNPFIAAQNARILGYSRPDIYVFADEAFNTVYFGQFDGAAPGVPEPANWALMILGFGGCGLALRRRRALVTALGMLALSTAAQAAPEGGSQTTPGFFADIGVGAQEVFAGDYFHVNPIGVAFTDNRTRGPVIILRKTRKEARSFEVSGSVGRQFANGFYARLTYRDLDHVRFHGLSDFTFAPDPTFRFDQDLRIAGGAVFAGAGLVRPLSPKWFVDGSAEVGVARFRLNATQGGNLVSVFGPPGVFPGKDQTNFSYGVQAGVGYRLTEQASVLLSATYDRYGDVETGVNPPTNAAYLNPGEQLRATDLQAFTTELRLRYRF